MKRIALLTVLLLALGVASSFAADVIAPTIVATADLKWGVTLDKNGAGDMVNGFNNSASILLYVPLISYQSMSSKGDGAIYGEFDLTNLELEAKLDALTGTGSFIQKTIAVDGGTGFSATAKIVAKPIEIGVYAAPGMGLDKVGQYGGDDISTAPLMAVALIDAHAGVTNAFTLYGTYVSYVSDALTLTGKILSTGDWTNATKNDYNIGAEAKVVFAPITLQAGGYYSLAAGNPAPLAWVMLDVAQPLDTMKLTAFAYADLVLATTMVYDASAGATFYLNSHKDSAGAAAYDTYVGADVVYDIDTFDAATTNDLALHVVFAEPADNGFVDKLAFQVDAWLQNLMTSANANTKVVGSGSYKVMLDDTNSATPSFGFTYGMHHTTAGYDASVLKANAGVSLSIIPKTTIAATWTSGNLGVATSLAGTLGNFIIDTTITF